jgi:hypothetical protein
MMTYEKLSDYKRSLKAFVRGVLKAKVFANEAGAYTMYLSKCDEDTKTVTVAVCNGTYCAKFQAEVATRIYNKFDETLFEPIVKQFGKLKGVAGITVTMGE